ncbi:MAG: hypothetical protein HC887_06425 [Desulfobacteraceae bacterium]|nr:hypothetical protein [Desulfobacteraceae bacterium]
MFAAFAVNTGIAMAEDKAADVPEILKLAESINYQAINNDELSQIKGERFIINGRVIWDWGWNKGTDICIGRCQPDNSKISHYHYTA